MLYFNSKAAYKVLESPGKRPRKGPGKSWKTGSWGLWQPCKRIKEVELLHAGYIWTIVYLMDLMEAVDRIWN